jgi:hypothetical protein
MGCVSRLFVWGTDDESGTEGWIPAHRRNNPEGYALVEGFYPVVSGEGFAHDVIEHFHWPESESEGHGFVPSYKQPIPAEMMALGQMALIRYEVGRVVSGYRMYVSNEKSAVSNIASAVRDSCDSSSSVPHVPACPAHRFDRDAWFSRHLAEVRGLFEAELSDYDFGPADGDTGTGYLTPDTDARDRILAWYAHGYRMAQRRWHRGNRGGSYPEHSANDLFFSMAEGMDKFGKHVDFVPGDKLHVWFSPLSFTWGHKVINRPDYY